MKITSSKAMKEVSLQQKKPLKTHNLQNIHYFDKQEISHLTHFDRG